MKFLIALSLLASNLALAQVTPGKISAQDVNKASKNVQMASSFAAGVSLATLSVTEQNRIHHDFYSTNQAGVKNLKHTKAAATIRTVEKGLKIVAVAGVVGLCGSTITRILDEQVADDLNSTLGKNSSKRLN